MAQAPTPQETGGTPAQPRASATVMLLQDGSDGIEVFMLRRHGKADFGDAWVFPGGLAAQSDYDRSLEPFCSGLDDQEASALLGIPEGGLGYWVAAIRECFEESGFLLARDFEGRLCQPGAPEHEARFADYRSALARGELTLREVCAVESLTLNVTALEYVSFWTTPVVMARRYATRFFVAGVPAGQHGVADGRETVDSRWVAPRVVLAAPDALADLHLHPPTRVNLQWLAAFDTVEACMQAAQVLDKKTIREIVPVINADGSRRSVSLPDGSEVPL